LLLRRRGPSLEGGIGVLEDGDELLEIGVQSLLGREENIQEAGNLVANEAFDYVLVGRRCRRRCRKIVGRKRYGIGDYDVSARLGGGGGMKNRESSCGG
jgi:hypothetical protein